MDQETFWTLRQTLGEPSRLQWLHMLFTAWSFSRYDIVEAMAFIPISVQTPALPDIEEESDDEPSTATWPDADDDF